MQNSVSTQVENRRLNRISLSLPIRVEGNINRNTKWDEITRLSDVSAFGVGFILKRPVKRGRLIQMTIPLPRKLRCYDYTESQYKVWGIVRRCLPVDTSPKTETYAHGVAFIGRKPPDSYLNDPSKIYDISHREEEGLWKIIDAPEVPDESHLPKSDRRHSRYPIPVSLTIESLDENRNVTACENTVAENISLSGAAVFTSLPIESGSFVRVNCDQYNVSIISIVRGKRLGKDNIPRLHIEFIDRFFPLEGIE
jgi:hypothetical protein